MGMKEKAGVKEETIGAFKRGERELENAKRFMGIDLPTTANRIYVAGENLAFSLLLALHGSSTRDHGKIWNAMQELYDKGVVKMNFKPTLETSYRLRIKADYGRDIGETALTISRETLDAQIKSLMAFLKEVKRVLKEKEFL